MHMPIRPMNMYDQHDICFCIEHVLHLYLKANVVQRSYPLKLTSIPVCGLLHPPLIFHPPQKQRFRKKSMENSEDFHHLHQPGFSGMDGHVSPKFQNDGGENSEN